jgi:hypothetical protein
VGVSKHLERFAGRPVVDFDPAKGIADPTGTIYRLAMPGWGKDAISKPLTAFLNDPRAAQVPALVVGCWSYEGGSSAEVVAALVKGRDKLPALRSLFLGDIVYEEQEISWIAQSNLSSLFPAFPDLEELWVRGGQGLSFGALEHARLKALAVESGGLPVEVVREIGAAELPALEHLELWLGADEYGGNATVDDLQPILSGQRFPQLVSLGLRDCEWADRLAEAVVNAPILRQLKVLDLSLGNLGDDGARALLQLPVYAKLQRLDIHHHYVSPEVLEQLRRLPFALDATEAEGPVDDEDRYVAHRE